MWPSSLATTLVVSLGGFAGLSSAYALDDTGKAPEINQNFLQRAIDYAFEMATQAYVTWDKTEVKELQNWIFGTDMNDRARAKSYFEKLTFTYEATRQDESLQYAKISFLCDTIVLRELPDEGKTRNEVLNVNVAGLVSQDCNILTNLHPSLAFTGKSLRGRSKSFIMLCHYYLIDSQLAKVGSIKGLVEAGLNFVRHGLSTISGLVTGTVPIDGFAMIETTILHELTHTLEAGSSRDMDDLGAYGWKNIRKLAGPRGCDNADSLAYYALAVDLMIKLRAQIQENGDITFP